MRGKHKEIMHLRDQEASRQQRIAKAREDLAEAEQEQEDLPPFEHPKDELVCYAFLPIDTLLY